MADKTKYDGSTNPFDDPDEMVEESAQEYTSLNLPPRQVQHKGECTTTENRNNNYNQKLTTTNNSNNLHNNTKSTNQNNNNNNEKTDFLQKTKNAFVSTSDKIGQPIISITQKMNAKFTKWFNI